MLVRVTRATSGIKDYLERGRKKGREFDRDLIDERIILDGDIELLEAAIENIQSPDPDASRYLHITLGFAEEFTQSDIAAPGTVNERMLREIGERFKTELMAAYQADEYLWYAEAHIPKISHDVNASTGAYEERLPHIHIVIPMQNLVDSHYLNPLGYGNQPLKYLDAIQEKINSDYGLKSPKDSKRVDVDLRPHPLHKHNPVFSEQTPAEIKRVVGEGIRAGEIASFEQLGEYLKLVGEVRLRNGKDGDYYNIKPEWATKGINLKDFKADYFAGADASAKEPGIERAARDKQSADLVEEWIAEASLRARFVTSGNRKAFAKLSAEEKQTWLQEKRTSAFSRAGYTETENINYALQLVDQKIEKIDQQQSYRINRLRGLRKVLTKLREITHGKPGHTEPAAGIAGQSRDSSGQSAQAGKRIGFKNNAKHQSKPGHSKYRKRAAPQALDRMPNMSAIPLARWDGAEVLLQDDARNNLDDQRAKRPFGLRWPLYADGRRGIAPAASSKTALQERVANIEPPPELQPDRLKADTDPFKVLELAKRVYGIDPTNYGIAVGKDGTPRITHERKTYNLGDFFTKHLEKPWSEARLHLVDAYYQTLAGSLNSPNAALWAGFNQWSTDRARNEQIDRSNTREAWRLARTAARESYQNGKTKIAKMPKGKRQAAMRVLRAERVLAEQTARELATKELTRLIRPERSALYRMFLQESAQRGDTLALDELRRSAGGLLNVQQLANGHSISGDTTKAVFAAPGYRVGADGKVVYMVEDRALVADSAANVEVLKGETNAYDLALRVAVARYGSNLTLNGDQRFMDGMLAAAKKSGLALTIHRADSPRSTPIKITPQKGKGL